MTADDVRRLRAKLAELEAEDNAEVIRLRERIGTLCGALEEIMSHPETPAAVYDIASRELHRYVVPGRN